MSRHLTMTVLVMLMATTAPRVWAHDGHTHTIMGTVVDRDAKALQVKTPGGEVLSMAITKDTTVVRGKSKATVSDVSKGVRVVVDIGNGEDPLVAHEIRLGAVRAATK